MGMFNTEFMQRLALNLLTPHLPKKTPKINPEGMEMGKYVPDT